MDPKLLEDIGLTEGEAKIYLSLTVLGTVSTGPIALKSGVSLSKVYKILERLEKKGLVGHVIINKTRNFKAMDPRRIIELLELKEKELSEKKKKVKELIPQINLQRKLLPVKNEAIVYDGTKAIMNFYNGILTELKAGESYYVLGASYGEDFPGLREFFQNYHTRRAKKKIKMKMLANIETKDNLEKATYLNSKIKFLPKFLVTNMIVIFYKNKTFIYFLTTNPKGFLIENKDVQDSFKIYFETFWKMS
ncbi:MAG: helix-turn-helix domain-containing protein [Candidatus Nanoarchaeia archaeon]|jgi:sugar-specific transcriptional regulator TrmB|nr:helix-turn-helix domain-containing protein [Candidatus Nanoarchaeia archaeon]|tara:strand:- start:165 stop:911 length:747 start_codon:yes stop_codon:yes gene_type:complete